MAYFKKLKTGWRAAIDRRGVRKSKMFSTKAEALNWATEEEALILAGKAGALPGKTLADAFDRYELEVSSTKRGARMESMRFAAWRRDFPELCAKVMHEITPADLAGWRDARRRTVSDSSVVREGVLLRHVWSVAIGEWGWCEEPSPWKTVKMPREAHARTRRTTWREVRRLVRHMGYVTGKAPETPQQEVALAYLVAQATAMRAGEVLGLSRSTVNLATRVATLHSHKTVEREGVRFVPFTRKAARLLSVLDASAKAAGRDGYFTISSHSLDTLFRRVRDRLLLSDVHFHDSRADALTRLSRRMDVLRLSKISGHRDLNQLLTAYYRESAADIASTI